MNKNLHTTLVKICTIAVTHCFTAAITVSLLRKYFLRSPSFVGLNRWKSEHLQLSQHCNVVFKVDGLSGFHEIQKDHPFLPFIYQKMVCITFSVEGCILNFFLWEFTCCCGLPFWFQLIVLTACLFTSYYVIQETVTFKLVLVQ